jgi:hypothetical protein
MNHVRGRTIRQWLVAGLPVLRNCFRFRGIADMTGLVSGTTPSRMTP